MQFKDEYYQKVDGGRQAALDFREAVREYIGKKLPHLSSLPIIVKAYANGDGLSRLLVKANIINQPLSLIDFVKGFSQAYETCDFVLVGTGKDRADVKIKGKCISLCSSVRHTKSKKGFLNSLLGILRVVMSYSEHVMTMDTFEC